MNVYVILLHRRRLAELSTHLPLDDLAVTDDERERLQAEVESHGIEPLDIITSLAIPSYTVNSSNELTSDSNGRVAHPITRPNWRWAASDYTTRRMGRP